MELATSVSLELSKSFYQDYCSIEEKYCNKDVIIKDISDLIFDILTFPTCEGEDEPDVRETVSEIRDILCPTWKGFNYDSDHFIDGFIKYAEIFNSIECKIKSMRKSHPEWYSINDDN